MGRIIIGISGIRGRAGKDLTIETARDWGRAFGRYLGGGGKIATVGRDTRPSGKELAGGIMTGLRLEGIRVIDLGICSTPTVEMAIPYMSAHGGVIVTASHNPLPDNGFKFLGRKGIFLDEEETYRLMSHHHDLKKVVKVYPEKVVEYRDDAFTHHMNSILSLSIIDPDSIRASQFKVALDSVNSVGSPAGRILLEGLGCTVHEINSIPDGHFGRGAEPIPENLGDLEDAVKRNGMDMGFALDPDGDRLSLVSEEGVALGEEYTLALAAKYILGKRKGDVVCNLSTSRMLDDITVSVGVRLHRSPVGEINVVRLMESVGAVVGGEGSGGVILPELHYGRDGFLAMALILALLSEGRKTLSQEAVSLHHYHMIKKKFPLPEDTGIDWKSPIIKSFSDAEIDRRDGIKVVYPDRWVHIRESHTEPILRVIAEAPSSADTRKIINTVLFVLSDISNP